MSEVIYLIGAGASYGKRGINNKTGEEIPGEIERGLPIVNQLEPAIDRFCWSIAPYHSDSYYDAEYPNLYRELTWLREKCKTYPTIDTYAKKLSVTGDKLGLFRLKKALSAYFALIQSHEKRDLRYDGLIASIIGDDGSLPNHISILSWNYDYQIEFVLQDFSPIKMDLLQVCQNQGITCKGVNSSIDNSRFNCVKLNGTAMFSNSKGELIDPCLYNQNRIEKCFSNGEDSLRSNISFAWEKDDSFIDGVLPLIKDTKVLVIIGYSFPYVNRAVDRKIVQNMNALRTVYIQDKAALDVKQSFETLLSNTQQQSVNNNEILIYPRTSVAQFIIPNELA